MAERNGPLGSFEFNPYAAGAKIYNSIASSPIRGAVDKTGYAVRDRKLAAKRNAILAKMKAINAGNLASPNVQRFM